ncbi:MAG TPA: hypothetical protein VJQ50_16335 [Terriglobales bacterium]|nr:hypothetical protein [Terriglobales bacterium]
MHEQVLRDFFENKASATELRRDIDGSTKTHGAYSQVSIVDMDEEFTVTAAMAVRLCDVVLHGELPPEALKALGFALQASDKFCWDGDEDEVLANVISDWSCPDVNYPLTLENVERFRAWLLRIEPYPPKPPIRDTPWRITSVTEKKSARRWRKHK